MSARICTLCARGGSKGVPGKNIRMLGGRPLIAWSIQHAIDSKLFDLIAVSSDSDQILQASKDAGAHLLVKRPSEMATDQSSKIPAIRHCLLAAESKLGAKVEVFVDLAATSPLRSPIDIQHAVALLENSDADNVITGSESKCSPYFSLVEEAADGHVAISKRLTRPVVRRQDAPTCYDMNGSIYVWRRDLFCQAPAVFYPKTKLHPMPEERSIDIDTEMDFRIAEILLAEAGRHQT